jgi:hypothetical protein
MATNEAPSGAAFTNPVLVARLTMVRLLRVVDELEQAAARQDPWTVARLAREAHEKLEQAEAAVMRVAADLERDLATVAAALVDPTDAPAEVPPIGSRRRRDSWGRPVPPVQADDPADTPAADPDATMLAYQRGEL